MDLDKQIQIAKTLHSYCLTERTRKLVLQDDTMKTFLMNHLQSDAVCLILYSLQSLNNLIKTDVGSVSTMPGLLIRLAYLSEFSDDHADDEEETAVRSYARDLLSTFTASPTSGGTDNAQPESGTDHTTTQHTPIQPTPLHKTPSSSNTPSTNPDIPFVAGVAPPADQDMTTIADRSSIKTLTPRKQRPSSDRLVLNTKKHHIRAFQSAYNTSLEFEVTNMLSESDPKLIENLALNTPGILSVNVNFKEKRVNILASRTDYKDMIFNTLRTEGFVVNENIPKRGRYMKNPNDQTSEANDALVRYRREQKGKKAGQENQGGWFSSITSYFW